MPIAYVYNDHPEFGKKPYSEKFREDTITIPPMGKVEMDASEAVLFMGQFRPIKKYDNGDLIDPKALRMEVYHPCKECKKGPFKTEDLLKIHLRDVHAKALKQTVVHRCQLCREEFTDEEGLLAHGIDKHKEVLVDHEDAKRK